MRAPTAVARQPNAVTNNSRFPRGGIRPGRFLLLIALTTFHIIPSTRGAAPSWEKGAGFRSLPLVAPRDGKAGFTLLPPAVTGISFGNRLAEAAGGANRILENGSGVALGDVDGDGRCDIYFCALEGGDVLYRNLGDWKFTDITASAGVACQGQYSTGAVFADVDGDGDLDLLVNSIGGGTRLFLNDGRGHFTEAKDSGLVRQFGATSMALADIDGDGDLDLYVTNYRTTNFKDGPPDGKADVKVVDGRVTVKPEDRFTAFLVKNGTAVSVVEKGEPDILYLNDGKGHFTPVSWTGGAFLDEGGKPLAEPPREWGLSVMLRDINGDGWPDIYVCNDFILSRDRVWLNDGAGHFRAMPPLTLRNMSMSSMSVDFADINRDGHDDFFVADMLSRRHTLRQTQRANLLRDVMELPTGDLNYAPEVLKNTLFLNRGDGTYAEIAQLSGVNASEWSWSAIFLDVDLDGYEDLLITTGNNHDVLDADATRRLAAQGGPKGGKPALHYFPKLETGKLAFRNRGDLTFQDASAAWGFDATGIAHGMALADLDGDGDLDVVVNNFSHPAGVYRNDSLAPRLAVRLKGPSKNRDGIGAVVRISGGPVPQSQQMICGGRYLSGDETMRVFAAGALTNELTIDVHWRDGKTSVVRGAKPGRLYEIDEAGATEAPARNSEDRRQIAEHHGATPGDSKPNTSSPPLKPQPLFEDVSRLISHTHEDEPFDDFARQPLLPNRLSNLGPGVTWFDMDGDGWEDLIIAGGRGGRLAVFKNAHGTGFARDAASAFAASLARDQTTVLGWRTQINGALLLAGSANYEDGLTNGTAMHIYMPANNTVTDGWHGQSSSVGALAMADIDGDGELDLFAAARVLPGRYPEPPSSRFFRSKGGRFRFDIENSKRLRGSGMISGVVFSDIDGDGDPDLVLACEWGPVRVFLNSGGVFSEVTEELGLGSYLGRWNGVTTGDFDGDGRMDIVASNWGRNTKHQNYLRQPIHLYHGDFNGDGRVHTLEAFYDPDLQKVVPWAALDQVAKVIPAIQERFNSYRDYGSSSVQEILGDAFSSARDLRVTTLDSMVFLNRGDHFEARPLPVEAQFAPAFGVAVADIDGDGNEDIFLSQNFFGTELETPRFDGGLGLWLRGDGKGGFESLSAATTGVRVFGEQRGCALADYDGDGRTDLVVTQNHAETKLYRNVGARPGLRVRLAGPPENPAGVGSILRLECSGRWGPAREIHLGSGYWSQDGAVPVLGTPAPPTRIQIRWPGAPAVMIAIPPDAKEILVKSGEPAITRTK
jgi:hypothetical protein